MVKSTKVGITAIMLYCAYKNNKIDIIERDTLQGQNALIKFSFDVVNTWTIVMVMYALLECLDVPIILRSLHYILKQTLLH
jgi:hypothetical protein